MPLPPNDKLGLDDSTPTVYRDLQHSPVLEKIQADSVIATDPVVAPVGLTQKRPFGSRVVRVLQGAFESPSGAHRVIPMEGVRAFAALLVFLAHFHTPFQDRLLATPWLFTLVLVCGLFGQAGVDIFFVLSGFLMYGAILNGRKTYASFVGRRVQRIYPTFTVVFILYVVLSVLFPLKSKIPAGASGLAFLGYNFLMLPGIFPLPIMILPAWSLSYEWLFYLSMPLALWALKARSWPWWLRAAFCGALSFSLALWEIWCGPLEYHRLALFGVGIVLWELNAKYNLAARLPAGLEWLVAVLFIVNLISLGASQFLSASETLPRFWTPSLYLTSLPFIAYSLFGSGILSKMFSWAPLRWIGNFSYSYYLIHSSAIQGLKIVVDKYFPDCDSVAFITILFLVTLIVTLMAGAALYLCVEKPLLPSQHKVNTDR